MDDIIRAIVDEVPLRREDHGVGAYEYWGAKGVDVQLVWVPTISMVRVEAPDSLLDLDPEDWPQRFIVRTTAPDDSDVEYEVMQTRTTNEGNRVFVEYSICGG